MAKLSLQQQILRAKKLLEKNMPSFQKHCERSEELFGNPYREVHIWLDEFAGQLGYRHRQKRHHRKGIQEVDRLFGNEAAKAARQHVMDDLIEWGWRGRIPEDEADFEGMWLSFLLGGRE